MAEKEEAKWDNPAILLLLALVSLSLVSAILTRISTFFSGDLVSTSTGLWGRIVSLFISLTPIFWMIAIALCGIMLMAAIYFSRRIGQILAEMRAPLYPARVPGSGDVDYIDEPRTNPRWERILEHINSEHPSDWKIAILEADIMLDEVLDVQGYRGETMSDKLKQVERSDFLTIDQAWEAHKVRNQIAHEGAEFLINEREARRIIDLYRQVFEEFQYI